MSANNPRHHRRSLRLPGYDYTTDGAYYVTICVQDMMCLFGDIVNGEMALNEYGRVADEEWVKTAQLRPYVSLDSYVVMPNHIHGILMIVDGGVRGGMMHEGMCEHDNGRGTMHRAPTTGPQTERFGKPVAGSLPTIVRCYTAAVTRQINRMRNTPGCKLWQRGYWEHVVRNDMDLARIRKYIIENPRRWAEDEKNPNKANK